MQITIPAQSLNQALLQLGQQTDIQIYYLPETVAGLNAPAVSGNLTAEQALRTLLQGTGVQVNWNGKTVSLSRPASGEAAELAPIMVQGASNPTTEGTGSYTATGPSATATPLGLTLRETPQSVSVLTKQQLEDQNLLTLGDAIKNVTGINADSSDSDRTDIYSRGFYVDNYQHDGVPVTTANDFFGASTFDPVLYDRVEVVRGATGLMTGAGNPGAAINLVRKRATSKVFTGSASLGIGSWDHHRGTLDLSTPLTEDGRVRARVSAMAEERDSHLDRYHTRNKAILATVEADLTPATNLRIGIEHQTKRPTGVTWGGLPLVFSDGTPADWSRSTSIGADWTYWDTTNTTAFASLEHQFYNGWSIKANFSRLESDYQSKLLYLLGQPERATGEGLGAYPNYSEQELTQNSGSLQVSGPFDLFGRRHEAVVGLSSSKSRYTYGNYAYSADPIGNIYLWDGSYSEPIWGTFNDLGDDHTQQSAMYGALRLSLTDSLSLILGGRQNRWKMEGRTTTRSHDVFVPYAGLVYDFNPVYSGYISYTDIFQPQSNRDASGAYLDPVVGKSYEVGIKGEHLDGRINTSVAVFHIKQDNVAQLDGDRFVPGTTDRAYTGGKGDTSKGFEIQASGELTKGWNVSAGFARTIAEQADGARLNPHRPQNQLHLFSTYRLPGTWSKLTVGGGVRWRSGIYTDINTSLGISARREQGSIAVASLMASYEFTPQLSAQLNISNLFDKKYFDMTADGQGYYGEPRKAMLTMKYQF